MFSSWLLPWLACSGPSLAADLVEEWKGSRWFVEIEETTPGPVELSAEENFSFRTRALQVQAVLRCPEARPVGKKAVEVDCRVESVSIRATPRRLEPQEATNPGNDKVLSDIAERLQTTKVRFLATRDGRISSVGLPDLDADNRRESRSAEILRRLMVDVVSGFHLDRPDDWATQGSWTEKSTPLLRAPTEPTGIGISRTAHTVSVVDGMTIIQSEGKGTFTAPYLPWEYGYEGHFATRGSSSGSSVDKGGLGGGGASVTAAKADDGRVTGVSAGTSASTPTDRTFSGTLTSVTVMDTQTDMPSERVWAMLGRPTASSVGNMQGLSLYYAGRVRRLGDMEAVELGPTEVVAPPGQQLEGIGVWVPMTTF